MTWTDLTWPLAQTNGASRTAAEDAKNKSESILIHRQMPGVGDPKITPPDGQYTAYYPSQEIQDEVLEEQSCLAPATVSFQPHDWHKLPTLHHIVDRLAELPIIEVLESSVVKTRGLTDFSQLAKIEA